MEKKFRIKKDKVIMNNNFATGLTSFSSDEDCVKLLKLNEKFISAFEKFPSNWKEIISEKKTEMKFETKIEEVTEEVSEEVTEEVSEEVTEEVSEEVTEEVAKITQTKKQYKKRK